MQTRPFLFAELLFTTAAFTPKRGGEWQKKERERERMKLYRSSGIMRHLDHALSHGSACTTNPCNNLAPRPRVKCANVGNRHESVDKPVELQSPVGYKVRGETLYAAVKLKQSSSDLSLLRASRGRRGWTSGAGKPPV